MSDQESKKRPISWVELYQPFKTAAQLEIRPPLPKYQGLSEKAVIIASKSPRNARFGEYLGAASSSQLSHSDVLGRLRDLTIPSEASTLNELIHEYKEPRRSWSTTGDNGLSKRKGQIILAAILLEEFLKGNQLPTSFCLISKDFNIADAIGQHMDKGGFLVAHAPRIESWVQQGTDVSPIEPLDQVELLYRTRGEEQPRPFFVSNATSVLTCHISQGYSIDDIENFLRLGELNDQIQSRTVNSWMALLPDNEVTGRSSKEVSVYSPIELYSGIEIGRGGEYLYSVPGVIDWNRPPFNEHIQVWYPSAGPPINNNFSTLQTTIGENYGVWKPYLSAKADSPDVENEMVGVSTISLRQLLNI